MYISELLLLRMVLHLAATTSHDEQQLCPFFRPHCYQLWRRLSSSVEPHPLGLVGRHSAIAYPGSHGG
jgi:hypothetical protein